MKRSSFTSRTPITQCSGRAVLCVPLPEDQRITMAHCQPTGLPTIQAGIWFSAVTTRSRMLAAHPSRSLPASCAKWLYANLDSDNCGPVFRCVKSRQNEIWICFSRIRPNQLQLGRGLELERQHDDHSHVAKRNGIGVCCAGLYCAWLRDSDAGNMG